MAHDLFPIVVKALLHFFIIKIYVYYIYKKVRFKEEKEALLAYILSILQMHFLDILLYMNLGTFHMMHEYDGHLKGQDIFYDL